MTAFDRLPQAAAEIFGAQATAEQAYGLLTVDVPAETWLDALRAARADLGCTFFDWLSAVDEPGIGLRVCAHLAALPRPGGGPVRTVLLRTTVPHEAAVLPTATQVYAGAAWHERETYEMFGIEFTGHPGLVPLLLPEGFEGHPLRKDFVLAARVAKAWPGAKEPGESEHGGPKRRQMLPPGVPDPNEWGPLKGTLPPAPARPSRAAGAGTADRPERRARTAAEGRAGAAAEGRPRRSRSAAEGSASRRSAAPEGAEPPAASAPAAGDAAAPARRRSADAPWLQPPAAPPAGEQAEPDAGAAADAGPEAGAGSAAGPDARPDGASDAGAAAGSPEDRHGSAAQDGGEAG